MLQIDDLTYRHPKGDTLYHYTLDLDAGEVVAVMGRSGSGKSTLLDLIAGFLEPTDGALSLDGTSLLHKEISQRGVSILFQHHNLFEHLSVEQNIKLGAKEASKEQIAQMLDAVGLVGFAAKKASQLSGGEAQRVALARILLRKEPILLLDEPFSGLDTSTRQDLLALVSQMTQRYALHTIMVTHESTDAKAIANRTYIMQEGTLIPA